MWGENTQFKDLKTVFRSIMVLCSTHTHTHTEIHTGVIII